MSGYNGWTNRETWLVNLWFGDDLRELKQEGTEIDARYAEECVWDTLEVGWDRLRSGDAFASDLIAFALSGVNWQEIVDSLEG